MSARKKNSLTLKILAERQEASFAELSLRTGRLEGRFDGLEQRFDGLEQRFDGLERRFDGLELRLGTLEDTVDGLAGMVARGFEDLQEWLDGKFSHVYDRLDRNDSELRSTQFDQRKLKGRVEGLEINAFGSIQEA